MKLFVICIFLSCIGGLHNSVSLKTYIIFMCLFIELKKFVILARPSIIFMNKCSSYACLSVCPNCFAPIYTLYFFLWHLAPSLSIHILVSINKDKVLFEFSGKMISQKENYYTTCQKNHFWYYFFPRFVFLKL